MGMHESFGELALIKKENVRTATITVSEPVEFLCIDGYEFQLVLSAKVLAEQQQKLAIMSGNIFFHGWSDGELRSALESVSLRECPIGSLVCDGIKHTQPVDGSVFVVVSGSCRYIRSVAHPLIPEASVLLSTTADMPVGAVFTHRNNMAALCLHKTVVLSIGKIVFTRHDNGASLQVGFRCFFPSFMHEAVTSAHRKHAATAAVKCHDECTRPQAAGNIPARSRLGGIPTRDCQTYTLLCCTRLQKAPSIRSFTFGCQNSNNIFGACRFYRRGPCIKLSKCTVLHSPCSYISIKTSRCI
jgi:hypothetical protein